MQRAEAASGQFAQIPLSHLLIHALDQRLNGTLRIAPVGAEEQLIALRGGLPVRVLVPDAFALMSRVLLEFGSVSPSDPDLLQWDDTALGEALLAAGKIESSTLERALATQLGLRLVRIFSFDDATKWTFTTDEGAFEHIVSLAGRVDPLRVLWAGISRYGERGDSMTTTMHRVASLQFVLRGDVPIERFGFVGEAAMVAKSLREHSWGLESLCNCRIAPELLCRRMIYVLAITRFLDFSVVSEEASELEHVEAGTPAPFFRSHHLDTDSLRANEHGPSESAAIGRIELRRVAAPRRDVVAGPPESQNHTPLPGFSRVVDNYLVPEPSLADPLPTPHNLTTIECHWAALEALAIGHVDRAQRLCRQAREAEPDNINFAASMVWIELHLPHPDLKTLILRLDDVLARDAGHVQARYYRGCVHQRMGDEASAKLDFQLVLECEPSHTGASAKLSVLVGETVI